MPCRGRSAAAEVSGPLVGEVGLISPASWRQVGRMTWCGTGRIAARHRGRCPHSGEVELIPAASWSFSGGPNPSSWTVKATLPGPSRSITRRVPFSGSVIHQVWGSSPGLAYAGRSPLQFAAVSARLQVEVERSMGDETSRADRDAASSSGRPWPARRRRQEGGAKARHHRGKGLGAFD